MRTHLYIYMYIYIERRSKDAGNEIRGFENDPSLPKQTLNGWVK